MMSGNLAYKKRLQLLGIGFVLVLFLVYTLALKKTIVAAKDCSAKEEKLALSKQLEKKIGALRLQVAELDNIIGEMPDTSKKVMDLLLENITGFCSENNCILKEIPGTHQAVDANFEIETNFITVQGDFKNLLNLVYLLEQKKKTGGRVASVNFYSKKDFNTKRTALYLTLTVQHFKKRNDAKESS